MVSERLSRVKFHHGSSECLRPWNESAERYIESGGNGTLEDPAGSGEAYTRNFVTAVQNGDSIGELSGLCKKRDELRR